MRRRPKAHSAEQTELLEWVIAADVVERLAFDSKLVRVRVTADRDDFGRLIVSECPT